MKVFLSWSGETSRRVAEVFRSWLPSVIQAVKPYFSPEDIAKGARWHNEISNELQESSIGLIFITPENRNSEWILFEAGALSKHLDKNYVCPICFGLSPSDLKGPLSYFQAAAFERDEIKKILVMINESLGKRALEQNVLYLAFDKWWPELKNDIDKAINSYRTTESSISRTDRELLEEILTLSRESSLKGSQIGITEGEAEKLACGYYDLVDHLIDGVINEEIAMHLKTIYVYLSKMVEIGGYDTIITKRLDAAIRLLGEARINQ